MRIGFDAKRAFFNRSGLGNYSRDTISILSEYYPMNEYILYSPKPSKIGLFQKARTLTVKGPERFLHKQFSSFWRTYELAHDIVKDKIQLFHGLSNELPIGINKTKIASIVTIHDLIFLRYPQFYSSIDRKIYDKKFRYSANNATRVITISNQTKQDLMEYYTIPEKSIEVVYQGCNPIFWDVATDEKKNDILTKYAIPNQYILYVGTIEERKNLLSIVQAIHDGNIDFPLVVVGKPTSYYSKVKAYAEYNQVKNVFFLTNVPTEDLPALYQLAKLFIYPSVFEGFGIPILEALTSKVPVITTKGGCFSEAGGKSSIYIDPSNADEIAEAIKIVLNNSTIRDNMIIDGYIYAQQFQQDKIAQNMLRVYEKII